MTNLSRFEKVCRPFQLIAEKIFYMIKLRKANVIKRKKIYPTPMGLVNSGALSIVMKYIIMCGGPRSFKPLWEIQGETIINRTIRLLRENGIADIAISTNDARYEALDIPILHHDNPLTWKDWCWLRAFYPTDEPVCYIFGDVFFSPEAIKTIVSTDTEDIEFFASAPPFDRRYKKNWAEPFAFKVMNVERFFDCINVVRDLDKRHLFSRHPISWELWQVIKGTPLNHVIYTNYTVINDYTCDIDSEEQAHIITQGVL